MMRRYPMARFYALALALLLLAVATHDSKANGFIGEFLDDPSGNGGFVPAWVIITESDLVTEDLDTPSSGSVTSGAEFAGNELRVTRSIANAARGPGDPDSASYVIKDGTIPGFVNDGTMGLAFYIQGITTPAGTTAVMNCSFWVAGNDGDVTDAATELIGGGLEWGGAGVYRSMANNGRTGATSNVDNNLDDEILFTVHPLGDWSTGSPNFARGIVQPAGSGATGNAPNNPGTLDPLGDRYGISFANHNADSGDDTFGCVFKASAFELPNRTGA